MTTYLLIYDRCIAAGQWQHAAAIRGCSQHTVRLEHDPTYRLAQKALARQRLRTKKKAQKPSPRRIKAGLNLPHTHTGLSA